MRFIKILGNEDEMIIVHTSKLNGLELDAGQLEFLGSLQKLFVGTVLAGDLFPVLWANLAKAMQQNLEILKAARDKAQQEQEEEQ